MDDYSYAELDDLAYYRDDKPPKLLQSGRSDPDAFDYPPYNYALIDKSWEVFKDIFFMVMVIGLIWLFGVLFCGCAQASETIEGYSLDQWVTAIGHAENSKTHPFGIMHKYRHTSPKKACANTVLHLHRNWRKLTEETGLEMPFLEYLARVYAPTIGADNDPNGLNRNWVKNVSFFLSRGDL